MAKRSGLRRHWPPGRIATRMGFVNGLSGAKACRNALDGDTLGPVLALSGALNQSEPMQRAYAASQSEHSVSRPLPATCTKRRPAHLL